MQIGAAPRIMNRCEAIQSGARARDRSENFAKFEKSNCERRQSRHTGKMSLSCLPTMPLASAKLLMHRPGKLCKTDVE
jgi:hypothetical protein